MTTTGTGTPFTDLATYTGIGTIGTIEAVSTAGGSGTYDPLVSTATPRTTSARTGSDTLTASTTTQCRASRPAAPPRR